MINNLHRKILTKVCNKIQDTFKEIPQAHVSCIPGNYNYHCFYNAADFAYHNPESKVIECIIIRNGYPILHYINLDKDSYIETSLGYQHTECYYFYLRTLTKDQISDIYSEFINTREKLNKELWGIWRFFGFTV